MLPGTDGLVHISQISDARVENVSDVLKEGQQVRVQVQDIDNRGRIKLTMKGIDPVSDTVDNTANTADQDARQDERADN